MKSKRPWLIFSCLLVLGLGLLLGGQAWARVGGGQSYSGGSSSSSSSYSSSSSSSSSSYSSSSYGTGGSSYSSSGSYSSSSDGGGSAAGLLIHLLIFFIVIVVAANKPPSSPVRATTTFHHIPYLDHAREALAPHLNKPKPPPAISLMGKPMLSSLQWEVLDPNFSRPVFLDFFGKLFTEIQMTRPGGLQRVAAYITKDCLAKLEGAAREEGLQEVRDVIIGSLRFEEVRKEGPYVKITVEVESNRFEHSRRSQRSYYFRERYQLRRKKDLLSRHPDRATQIDCPSCGNPEEIPSDGRCPYCEQIVARAAAGNFDWVVYRIIQIKKESATPPVGSGSGGVEEGTRESTRFHPLLATRREAFMTRYPDFDWTRFQKRAADIFYALQSAWSNQDWQKARPYETDNLFGQHRYWIEAYKAQGLRNRLDKVNISRMEVASIDSDAFYDAVTVRIFASMIDVTERLDNGQLHSGNPSNPLIFSEYWTFIRRIGRQTSQQSAQACPSCGAPLALSQAGSCEHCGSHITRGEFDWVLSQIEQDEAYQPS